MERRERRSGFGFGGDEMRSEEMGPGDGWGELVLLPGRGVSSFFPLLLVAHVWDLNAIWWISQLVCRRTED